jgi:hypothetical protein
VTVLDRLEGASKGHRSVDLILDADLEAEWQDLNNSLDEMLRRDEQAASLADPLPNTRAAIERMEELRDLVKASKVTFTFEPLPWTDRLSLQAEHPPREGNLLDRANGYNVVTFIPEVIRRACVSVTDAAGDTATEVPEATWVSLLGPLDPPAAPKLTMVQINRLFAAADGQNTQALRVPSSARSLLESQAFGASLARPEPGTPPPSGSTDGNPPGSATSSETTTGGSSES